MSYNRAAPWPNDCGARVQSTYNAMLNRTVRARWRRCLGTCGGRWFWSTDAALHRMCDRCSPSVGGGGDAVAPQQSDERAAEARRVPAQSSKLARPPKGPRAVICDGRQFPDVNAAADATGVTATMVRWRCTHGWRGWHYADRPAPEPRPPTVAELVRMRRAAR